MSVLVVADEIVVGELHLLHLVGRAEPGCPGASADDTQVAGLRVPLLWHCVVGVGRMIAAAARWKRFLSDVAHVGLCDIGKQSWSLGGEYRIASLVYGRMIPALERLLYTRLSFKPELQSQCRFEDAKAAIRSHLTRDFQSANHDIR